MAAEVKVPSMGDTLKFFPAKRKVEFYVSAAF